MSATIADVLEGRARWTVLEGDCLAILPTLPAKSVAHVITDPPYSEHVHSKQRCGGSLPDAADGEFPKACFSRARDLGFKALQPGEREALALEYARVARRWVLEFSDQEGAGPWMDAHVAAGLDHVRIGQWVKLNSTPQFTGDRPGTGAEAIVIAHPKGRKRWNGGGRPGVWWCEEEPEPIYVYPIEMNRGGANPRVHTTQKPLPLMLKLIEDFTDPDDVVLDSHVGSGTTGIACMKLGRRFVGIERDPAYVAVACDRIRGWGAVLDGRAGQLSLLEGT